MLTLSFNYLDVSNTPKTEKVILNPSVVYVINLSRVSVNALTYKNFKALKNFFEQFAKFALKQKILPDNSVNTVNTYLMSYLQTLSIAKLFQFGLQLPTGRQTYIYSMTQADRLAISNVAIQSNHNTINIITIALNIFLLDASVIKTKMLAFTKLNNGHKFITYTQNKKLKYKPFEALENTIRRPTTQFQNMVS